MAVGDVFSQLVFGELGKNQKKQTSPSQARKQAKMEYDLLVAEHMSVVASVPQRTVRDYWRGPIPLHASARAYDRF